MFFLAPTRHGTVTNSGMSAKRGSPSPKVFPILPETYGKVTSLLRATPLVTGDEVCKLSVSVVHVRIGRTRGERAACSCWLFYHNLHDLSRGCPQKEEQKPRRRAEKDAEQEPNRARETAAGVVFPARGILAQDAICFEKHIVFSDPCAPRLAPNHEKSLLEIAAVVCLHHHDLPLRALDRLHTVPPLRRPSACPTA